MTLKELKRRIKSFDYLMLFLVCILSVFGIIVIGSATHVNIYGDSLEYSRQKFWFISGIFLLIGASLIDYRFITKFYIGAYCINMVFLISVFLIGDRNSMGVARQLPILPGVSIQPSEFAKIFMLIYMAKFVDKFNEKINNIFILMLLLLSIAVPVYLVKEQPSLSASIVTFATSICIIFLGGISYRYIAGVFAVGVPAAIIIIQDILRPDPLFMDKILDPYHIESRIVPFFRPTADYTDVLRQSTQSMKAIASGQLTGQGLYNGTLNSLNFIPASHNDFIMAVIGEEFGYIGCMAVLFIILLIVLKCILIANKADTLTGRFIAGGAGFMLAFQTFVNVGVATKLLPNTGMALPFISYGGSAMWINMICIGLVINVGMGKPKSFFEE